MKFLTLCLVSFALVSFTFAQKSVSHWNISDYLENLPRKYKLFGNSSVVKENIILDNKNGYAAYMSSFDESIPILEMALFKPSKGLPTIVVTNLEDDHVCQINYTHILQRRGNKWIDVRSKVLPKLDFSMIFINGKNDDSYKYYQKMNKKYGDNLSDLEYKFHPPRNGTKMKVTLDLCDWADDSIAENEDLKEYMMILDSLKPLYLQWNKHKVKFEIVKD